MTTDTQDTGVDIKKGTIAAWAGIALLVLLWAGSTVLFGLPGLFLPAVFLTFVMFVFLVLISVG